MSAPSRYILSRLVSVLGLQFLSTTFVLSALALGGGPLVLGKLGFCAALASLFSTFPLGHWVDRMSRASAMRLSQLFIFLFCSLLALQGASSRPEPLFAAVAVFAMLRNFRSISQFSVFGEILAQVERPESWINLSTLSWQAAFVAGPLLTAGLFHFAGARGTYAGAGVLIAVGAWIQAPLLRGLARHPSLKVAEGGSFAQVKRHFASHLAMSAAMALDFVVVIFAGASAILPFLHGSESSPLQVGFLRAAMPLGVILATLGFLKIPVSKHWQGGLFVATFGFGLCHLALSVSPGVGVSFLILIAAGMCDGLSLSIREVLLQVKTPLHLKGRVYALNNFLVNASDELSEWESGMTAQLFGLRAALVVGSGITLAASIVFLRWMPAILSQAAHGRASAPKSRQAGRPIHVGRIQLS